MPAKELIYSTALPAEAHMYVVLTENLPEIEIELMSQARELQDIVREFIKDHDRVNKRRPPIFLQVKGASTPFQGRIVWSRMTGRKYNKITGKGWITTVVPGRRNFKYRNDIFDVYDEPLRTMLVEIEKNAAELRRRVSFWYSVYREVQKMSAAD